MPPPGARLPPPRLESAPSDASKVTVAVSFGSASVTLSDANGETATPSVVETGPAPAMIGFRPTPASVRTVGV